MRPSESKTVDENRHEVIGLRQASAESRPRIARRPPLPIDRRLLSVQGAGVGGNSTIPVERNRVPAPRLGSRSTVSNASGVNADVRQLVDEVRSYYRFH